MYGLVTYIHVFYSVLIIGKCFNAKNLKELLSNPYLGMKWCWSALFMHFSKGLGVKSSELGSFTRGIMVRVD